MLRKMMLLAMTVAALVAFAAPTVAQATLMSGGTALKLGTEVTATSTNMTSEDARGTAACEKVTIRGKVTNNKTPAVITPLASPNGMTWSGCKRYFPYFPSSTVTITNTELGPMSFGSGTGSAEANYLYSEENYAENLYMSGAFNFWYASGASSFAASGLFTNQIEQEWKGTFDLILSSTGAAVTIVG